TRRSRDLTACRECRMGERPPWAAGLDGRPAPMDTRPDGWQAQMDARPERSGPGGGSVVRPVGILRILRVQGVPRAGRAAGAVRVQGVPRAGRAARAARATRAARAVRVRGVPRAARAARAVPAAPIDR